MLVLATHAQPIPPPPPCARLCVIPVSCPQAEAHQQPSTANGTDSTDLQELLCTPTGDDEVHSITKPCLSLSSAQRLAHLHSANKEAPPVSQQPSSPALVQQHEL